MIIFYDGLCVLCSRSVQFVLKHDTKALFRFASLQSPEARRFLSERGYSVSDQPSTLVLFDGARVLVRTEAVISILNGLGGGWRLGARLLRLIPARVRNWGYEFVARHRYQFFGKRDLCFVPTEKEKSLFLFPN